MRVPPDADVRFVASCLIRLRYAARCARCNGSLEPGDRAYYDRVSRKVHCRPCGSGDGVITFNAPGTSARREYERRRAAREARLRDALPVLGGVVAALSQPQHEQAWARGAEGERRAAAALQRRLAREPVVILHDRRRPGTKANIDHLIVGPSGVLVIDSKKLRGPIRVETHGFLRPTAELKVDGRRRPTLVANVRAQVQSVGQVLATHDLAHVGVTGALLFVDGDLPLLGLPSIDGVVLGSPRKIARLAGRPGPLAELEVGSIARTLTDSFTAA